MDTRAARWETRCDRAPGVSEHAAAAPCDTPQARAELAEGSTAVMSQLGGGNALANLPADHHQQQQQQQGADQQRVMGVGVPPAVGVVPSSFPGAPPLAPPAMGNMYENRPPVAFGNVNMANVNISSMGMNLNPALQQQPVLGVMGQPSKAMAAPATGYGGAFAAGSIGNFGAGPPPTNRLPFAAGLSLSQQQGGLGGLANPPPGQFYPTAVAPTPAPLVMPLQGTPTVQVPAAPVTVVAPPGLPQAATPAPEKKVKKTLSGSLAGLSSSPTAEEIIAKGTPTAPVPAAVIMEEGELPPTPVMEEGELPAPVVEKKPKKRGKKASPEEVASKKAEKARLKQEARDAAKVEKDKKKAVAKAEKEKAKAEKER